jgi:hypothetical protein
VTPSLIFSPFFCEYALPSTMESRISQSWFPRNTETMAGGASFAPSRWSLPAVAEEERISAA